MRVRIRNTCDALVGVLGGVLPPGTSIDEDWPEELLPALRDMEAGGYVEVQHLDRPQGGEDAGAAAKPGAKRPRK